MAAALVVLLTWGCEDDSQRPDTGEPGVRIVAGTGVTDTAQAVLLQPLIVEVRDAAGALQPGAVVRFETTYRRVGEFASEPTVNVAQSASGAFGTSTVDTADVQGRAEVWVQLGRTVGPGAVLITVPELGVQDTATYEVLAGAPARLVMAPRDSAVYVGRSYVLRISVTDQNGNHRSDPVIFTSTPDVSVGADSTLTGVAIGRGQIVARVRDIVDTVWVSVVPRGVLAADDLRRFSGDSTALGLVNLDGSELRVLWKSPAYNEMLPSWAPSGTRLAVYSGDNLFTVDLVGNAHDLIQGDVGLLREGSPEYSRDGLWIYFSGQPQASDYGSAIYRVRPDGTGIERVGPPVGPYEIDWDPSPSPDGTRLVYTTNRVNTDLENATVRMLALETREVMPLDVVGLAPRWSPDGELIAFNAGYSGGGALRVMRPDGTGQRTVSAPGRRYRGNLDWSPDGAWIVARAEDTRNIELIHVDSGLTLPLAFTLDLANPAWQP